MEFFRNTNIEFMKYRKYFVVLSVALLAVSVFAVFIHGKLNIGIDFAGGTQVTLQFSEEPQIDELRELVAAAGVEDPVIQSFGDAGDNEVLIKTPTQSGQEEGSRDLLVQALNERYNQGISGFDLNQSGSESLADLLLQLDPDQVGAQDAELAREHYEGTASAVLEVRKENGLLVSWDQVEAANAATPEVMTALRQNASLGSFTILGLENVGPQIGEELRRKGVLAVVFSLLGMLIYIWFRFELRYGIGALVAVSHDVLIVLGLFALADYEFNLTTVAAFLTLIGYSVNDTVVVFDRVRENLRQNPKEGLESTMNRSLNQTLSRTVLTSGTTLLTVGSLFLFGGDVLRGFGFILTIGVIVGTYSSIYVASPFALLWEEVMGRKAKARRRGA